MLTATAAATTTPAPAPTPLLLHHFPVPDFKPTVSVESGHYYSKGRATQQQVDEPNHTNQQHPNSASESINTSCYDVNNFEIANRVFYATINKFNRQVCPDPSKRRSTPYSFLESWHLHSIYSKSQQTLLGITPVKPSVILSGDDFMFTPPFIQQFAEFDAIDEEELAEEDDYMCDDDDEFDDDDHYWTTTTNNFYTLSPCSETVQHGYLLDHSSNYDDGRDDSIAAITSPIESSLSETQSTKYEQFIPVQEPDYFDLQHELITPKDAQAAPPSGLLSIEIPQQNNNAISINFDNESLSPAAETPELSPSSIPDDQNALSRSSSISSLETDNEKNTYNEEQIISNCDSNCSSSDSQLHHDTYSLSPKLSSSSSDVTIITSTKTSAADVVPAAMTQQIPPKSPVTRSSFASQKSLFDDTCSVLSYQSFADIISSNGSSKEDNLETHCNLKIAATSSTPSTYGSIDSDPITNHTLSHKEASSSFSSLPETSNYLYDEESCVINLPASPASKYEHKSISSFVSCFRYLFKKVSTILKNSFDKLFKPSHSQEQQPLL